MMNMIFAALMCLETVPGNCLMMGKPVRRVLVAPDVVLRVHQCVNARRGYCRWPGGEVCPKDYMIGIHKKDGLWGCKIRKVRRL